MTESHCALSDGLLRASGGWHRGLRFEAPLLLYCVSLFSDYDTPLCTSHLEGRRSRAFPHVDPVYMFACQASVALTRPRVVAVLSMFHSTVTGTALCFIMPLTKFLV